MHDLKNICFKAQNLIKEVGDYIQEESQKLSSESVIVKGKNNFVTYIDQNAENKLVEGLNKLLPEAGFITEEETEDQEGYYQWIIDPLDGTTNFIHQIPFYAISIALTQNDKLVLGIVYEINRKECFYAWEGSPAFLNDAPICISSCPSLSEALIATGFPYEYFEKLDAYIRTLNRVIKNSRGVRRLGSAALDLAYVACGRFDGFFEYNLSPWDVAGGAFIVQQAGGIVTDFSNGNNFVFGREIIAGNNAVNKELVDMLQENFTTPNPS